MQKKCTQEYSPLTKKEIEEKGWGWKDNIDEIPEVEKTIPADRLPDKTEDIPDDVLNWAIKCEATEMPFQIIKQELAHYRKHGIHVPRRSPNQRHQDRIALRTPRTLFSRTCGKCGKDIQTSYSPERPAVRGSEEPSGSRGEKVYCESCYLAEVY